MGYQNSGRLAIHGLTVSVDYAPLLKRGIEKWLRGLHSLVVVTSLTDEATASLAERMGCPVHRTGAFFEDGALFNKGRALQEARRMLPSDGWHLLLDADVIPPDDWLAQLEAAEPQPGTLHGARRVHEDGRLIDDRELAGFFQLFHSSDPRAAAPLATNFYHSGCYDSLFMQRWPHHLQRILPLELVHLGEVGVNWCGIGNEAAMKELRDRRRRGRSWRRETI